MTFQLTSTNIEKGKGWGVRNAEFYMFHFLSRVHFATACKIDLLINKSVHKKITVSETSPGDK